MQKKSFYYDFSLKTWHEFDSCMSFRDIELCPTYIIVKWQEDSDERIHNWIWCPKHHTYEEVDNQQEHTLTTKSGCKFSGLFGVPISQVIDIDGSSPLQDVNVRFRFQYNDTTNVLTIFSDMARVGFQSSKDWERRELSYIPFLRQHPVEIVSIKLADKRIIPEEKLENLPVPIAKAAIAMLIEKVASIYGQPPQIPGSVDNGIFTSGKDMLLAFVEYPYDMNLWPLRKYFYYERDYKDIYSEPPKDIFINLCRKLEYEPYNKLRRIYDVNPFALPISCVLSQLGVTDENLVIPFLNLKTFLGDSVPDGLKEVTVISRGLGYNYKRLYTSLFYKDDNIIRRHIMEKRGFNSPWDSILFYCRYRLYRQGEEALAKYLLKLNNEWEPRFLKTIRLFHEYYPELPTSIKDSVIEEGISVDVHNSMVDIINPKKLAWPEFTYTEEVERYECIIDRYAFCLIRSSEQYRVARGDMWHGNTNESIIPNNGIIRMVIYHSLYEKEKPLAYIEINGIVDVWLTNDMSIRTELRTASIRIAILHWLKWTGLWKDYGPYHEEDYYYLEEDVAPEPLPKDIGTGLYELLNSSERGDGYYYRLYKRLMKDGPICHEVTPPTEYDDENEMEYLMKLFPYGKKLYEAAFAGNIEAQHVLATLYYNNHDNLPWFPFNKERAEYWLSKTPFKELYGRR